MIQKAKWAALPLALLAILGASCPGGGDVDVWAVTPGVGDGGNNVLIKFDLDDPSQIDSSVAITGLGLGEGIVGMDFRPATGVLYAFTVNFTRGGGTLYTINLGNGVATPVGGPIAGFADGGGIPFFGFDFDPVNDEIRIVTDINENARIDPDTGFLTFETDINPASSIVGIAYTNNSSGTNVSTLLGLDSVLDDLVRIGGVDGNPSPNGGVVTSIADTGIDIQSNTAFDIHEDGTAVAVTTSSRGLNFNDVYTVNLETGQVVFKGSVSSGGTIVAAAIRP